MITWIHSQEWCEDCEREYYRDVSVDITSTDAEESLPYYVKCKLCQWNHYTGNDCEACGGKVRTILA
jgi:hypothetical protein